LDGGAYSFSHISGSNVEINKIIGCLVARIDGSIVEITLKVM